MCYKTCSFFILGNKQYAYLRLLFDLSNVPSNYYTAQWQTSLQNVIFHTLLNVSSSTPSNDNYFFQR